MTSDSLSEIKKHRKDLLINGVYSITNIGNGNTYIGSSAAKDFLYVRLRHNIDNLQRNKHHNKQLQAEFNKYGIENFIFSILSICKPGDCIQEEQRFIDELAPSYNLCKTAGSTLGIKYSEETRRRLGEISKKRWKEHPTLKENMSKVHKGKKLSEEEKKAISARQLGKSHSEETKMKMSEARRKYWENKRN